MEVDYSFAGLDLDGDGRVSKKEWDTAFIHDTFDWHLGGKKDQKGPSTFPSELFLYVSRPKELRVCGRHKTTSTTTAPVVAGDQQRLRALLQAGVKPPRGS